MKTVWKRLITAAIAAEVIPIVILVAIVALVGPGETSEAQDFANRTGRWFGPIAGGVVTFLFAVWLTRPLVKDHSRYGLLLGLLVAVLDASLLVVSGASFDGLFVLSGLGRILMGFLGGYIVSKRLAQAETIG